MKSQRVSPREVRWDESFVKLFRLKFGVAIVSFTLRRFENFVCFPDHYNVFSAVRVDERVDERVYVFPIITMYFQRYELMNSENATCFAVLSPV